jgi:hypothetical protein
MAGVKWSTCRQNNSSPSSLALKDEPSRHPCKIRIRYVSSLGVGNLKGH